MTSALLREYVELVIEKIRTKKGVDSHFGEKFDIKKFRELRNTHVMLQYARTFLTKLGEGSSRAAFLLSGKYVLKIAVNKKGLAQNQAEVDVYTNPKSKPVVAKIYSADPQYHWLISDLVKELHDPREFEQLSGIDWYYFGMWLHRASKSGEMPSEPNKLLSTTLETMKQNDLKVGDINVLSHWGKTPDGRLVILDYGFTGEVFKKHYQREKTPDSVLGHDEKTAKIDAQNDPDKTGAAGPAAKKRVA